ncbi:universal stress protein [Streptomyces fragilis]|uniref:Universal stress protein n=1 Tax=Streptomyces fragilis TaxID=67301 RepID=A0ABV2YGL7_9ACTN|nr:universal stress protein [Streptomyces fragilis]
MDETAERSEIVVGVDPARDVRLPVYWAVDEAERRRAGLRLVVAVPPPHDTQHVDDGPRFQAQAVAGRNALASAADLVRERSPGTRVATALLEGRPAQVMAGLSRNAVMVVLGSRRLRRTEEFLGAGSLVVPVTAQAGCPVAVVGDAEHATQAAPYLVVGVDGSESSRAALAFAAEEARLRGCALRTVAVWQPPVFTRHPDPAALQQAESRLLGELTAPLTELLPDLSLTHEVTSGSPVEVLAGAAEHALAVVVGRRGHGGYSGMRVGSVVHGLLHRAHCPVITVPAT